MKRIMLKSKIHSATITETNLNYEGSITIDEELLKKADMLPGEQVHVLNINNSARFITYIIKGEGKSGAICLNGAASRMGEVGDKVLVLSYCEVDDSENPPEPNIVFVDEKNKLR